MPALIDNALVVLGSAAWVLFGVLILVVHRLAARRGGPAAPDAVGPVFVVLGWVFIASGTLTGLYRLTDMGMVGVDSDLVSAILAILFSILLLLSPLLIIALLVYMQRRRAQQQAMLWTLAVAAERSVPLTAAVEAVARERRGWARRQAQRLARLIEAGTPLPDALTFVHGVVPQEALVPIHVGHEVGAFIAGLRQATAPPGPFQALWNQLAGKMAYLVLLLLWTGSIAAFMAIRLMPAFEKIFSDYGVEVPAAAQVAMNVISQGSRVMSILCTLVVLLFLHTLLRYLGLTSLDLPLAGYVVRRLHTARILDALALAAERNQPLTKALVTLAYQYPRWSIRRRLQRVVVDVTSGADWVQSLRRWGLISAADPAMLHAAQRVGNLAWALTEVADAHRRRLASRLQGWIQILFPAAIVCFGLVVFTFWISYFLPMVASVEKFM